MSKISKAGWEIRGAEHFGRGLGSFIKFGFFIFWALMLLIVHYWEIILVIVIVLIGLINFINNKAKKEAIRLENEIKEKEAIRLENEKEELSKLNSDKLSQNEKKQIFERKLKKISSLEKYDIERACRDIDWFNNFNELRYSSKNDLEVLLNHYEIIIFSEYKKTTIDRYIKSIRKKLGNYTEDDIDIALSKLIRAINKLANTKKSREKIIRKNALNFIEVEDLEEIEGDLEYFIEFNKTFDFSYKPNDEYNEIFGYFDKSSIKEVTDYLNFKFDSVIIELYRETMIEIKLKWSERELEWKEEVEKAIIDIKEEYISFIRRNKRKPIRLVNKFIKEWGINLNEEAKKREWE